ncbi:MAG: DUF4286 family protein, partial [Chitinophagales bacterium]
MIIYNVTVKVNRGVEEEWLRWMKSKHIPDVLETKQFVEANICLLLDQPDKETSTYVVQYRCESLERLNFYIENFAPALREDFNRRFGTHTTLS